MKTSLLSDKQYETALRAVRAHLQASGTISNAALRSLTGLTYDQAIRFFNTALTRGDLVRHGRGSATHYVRPSART